MTFFNYTLLNNYNGDFMKFYIFMIIFTYFVVFDHNLINANNIIEGLEIYNMQSSDKYLVIEYKKNINDKFYHYVSLYDSEKAKLIDIYNDDGELINDNMYFPSISKDGRYVVFTSRASNIIPETMLKCYDVYEGVNKICNNVYIYDTLHKKFFIVKYNGNMLNGDSYVAKISGNGNYIVFESIASNLINANHDCSDLNGIKMCINIYKYNFLNDNIQLISTGLDGSGSNRNSISPTIDYEGRYVTYQSNSSNIVQMSSEYNYCINTYTSLSEPCTNIYLVDTLKLTTKIISKGVDYVLNSHSINAIISLNGMFVAYESYATNIFETVNYKKHIILYDLNKNINKLITVSNNVLNNRDNHRESISYDGKYILYRTASTNLNDNQNIMEIYVCNTTNFKTSIIVKNYHDVLLGTMQNNNVYFYNDDMIVSENMADIQPPQILENQSIYVLKSDFINVNNKISVIDNLSDKSNIQILDLLNPPLKHLLVPSKMIYFQIHQ